MRCDPFEHISGDTVAIMSIKKCMFMYMLIQSKYSRKMQKFLLFVVLGTLCSLIESATQSIHDVQDDRIEVSIIAIYSIRGIDRITTGGSI